MMAFTRPPIVKIAPALPFRVKAGELTGAGLRLTEGPFSAPSTGCRYPPQLGQGRLWKFDYLGGVVNTISTAIHMLRTLGATAVLEVLLEAGSALDRRQVRGDRRLPSRGGTHGAAHPVRLQVPPDICDLREVRCRSPPLA